MNTSFKFKNMTASTLVLFISTLSIALITGLWYAYSCSVNPALGALDDKGYLLAMQSINRVILNPVFFATFMGTLFLLPLSAWLCYRQPGSARFVLMLAAAIIYAVGVFGVTIGGNVPLNEALDAFDTQSATPEEMLNFRTRFEMPWNKWHRVRTVASFFSLMLAVAACMVSQGAVEEPAK